MISNRRVFACVSIMAIASASAAVAQEAPAAGNAAAPAVDMAVQDGETQTGEIVVTARRRNELLQDVPIAVSAISGEMAQRTGITSTEALTVATPSLDFSRQISQGATPFLRGVGSLQSAAGSESPVAVYVDDVYVSSPNGNLFGLSNVASVQVLKGPQGTLFGRNATGGVIQVTTKRPSQETQVEAQAGYGNYDTVEGSFYGTTGLTDTLAINFAAAGRKQHDGYGRSLVTGADVQLGWDWSLRGQALWEPTDRTRVLLIGDYGKQDYDYGTNSTVIPGTVAAGGTTFAGAFNTRLRDLDYARIKQGGVSLRIDQETSFANLVSISAYRHTFLDFRFDQDGGIPSIVQAAARSPNDTFSQEVQIVSKDESALKWIVGAYYLNVDTGNEPARVSGLPALPNRFIDSRSQQKLNSISVFGEGTYEILPATNLTLGLRYTKDSYDFRALGRVTDAGVLLPNSTFDRSASFPKVTYRAILDHKFSPDILGYASYSRGFKSGGYNLLAPGTATNPAPAIRPEVLDSFEVGLKTKLFNGALTLNGAAYYYDYKDLAVTLILPVGSIIVNAASAEIKGLDLDFILTPMRGLRLAGGVGFIDGEYKSFPNGPVLIPSPATCTPVPAQLPGPRTGGNTQCVAELGGNTTARSPKFTLSLSPSYSFATAIGEITLAAAYYHNSGFFWDATNRLTQPTYDLLNTSLSWESSNRNFGLRVWAKNLLDERYFVYSASNTTRDQAAYAAPRTYGATLTVRY